MYVTDGRQTASPLIMPPPIGAGHKNRKIKTAVADNGHSSEPAQLT